MNKRKISLALLTAMLSAQCLTGCGSTPGSNTVDSSAEITTVEETTVDSLPADLDFGGAEVKLNAQLWMTITKNPIAEFYAEEVTGDVVDDAIYYRKQAVEDRLNVIITMDCIETTWDTRMNWMNYVTNSIMANDNAFDATFGIVHLLPGIAVDGNMLDLNELKYFDFDAPWWSTMYNKKAELGGKLYFVTGDLVLGIYKHSYCMYFNHELVENLSVPDPYELVESGEWTLDKLRKISASCYSDLNGNTKPEEDDRWGLVIEGGNQISGFLESCDVNIINFSEDGKSGEYVFGNSHNIDVVDKVNQLLHESDGIFYKSLSSDIPADQYIFTDGNVVFTGGWIGDTDYYRDLNFDFGIIPYPKYDETQKNYYTRLGTACHAVSIPVTCQNPDMVSAVLEAMASESYRSVRPAYFDTALKEKYSRDEKTKEMVDLLINNITVDFGTIYVNSLDNISDKFKISLAGGCTTWASMCESWRTSVTAKLESLLDAANNK